MKFGSSLKLENISSSNNEILENIGLATRRYVEDEFNDRVFYNRLMEIYKGVLQ